MAVRTVPVTDPGAKSALCASIAAELPMWFGRPESNAHYADGIAGRQAFAAHLEGEPCGLIALEYQLAATCNIWWMGVRPAAHRRGVGLALIDRAADEAVARGCRYLVVETVSARVRSAEYEITRRFYEQVGFEPLLEHEPSPGDWMLWMIRHLRAE